MDGINDVNVEVYTKEDFTKGTAPFEEVYKKETMHLSMNVQRVPCQKWLWVLEYATLKNCLQSMKRQCSGCVIRNM